ncbi:MAG: hypothetical protein WBD87_00015 [Candidatus Acidiferrales bacterium]
MSINAADAQSPAEPQQSAQETAEQFYKMETQGRWLGPEHWDELQDYFSYDVGAWRTRWSVLVLKGYYVGRARKDIGYKGVLDYQVEVDCSEWGEIDSVLNFTAAQGPSGETAAASKPVEQRIYTPFYLSDKVVKSDSSGHQTVEKAPLRWRMPLFAPPAVNVDAALRWVTQTRDKSTDPLIKYNADRTIAILKSLSTGTLPSLQPIGKPLESASEIARQFIDLESRLTPDRWGQLAKFFAETPKPLWDHATIVDVVGTGASANGDSAEAEVSTNSLGELDSSMRLSKYPQFRQPLDGSSASACFGDDRFGFDLLLSTEHWETAKDGTVEELNGPLAWRVEGGFFGPLLNLDTAIRYVTQTRDKTSDPAVKMNAAKTLRILNYYQRGKPAPDNLSSESSGGCG